MRESDSLVVYIYNPSLLSVVAFKIFHILTSTMPVPACCFQCRPHNNKIHNVEIQNNSKSSEEICGHVGFQ